ncbi:MAG: radical SAM protein [bacterium]
MVSVGLIIPTWFYWNKPFAHQPLTQLYLATLIDEHFNGKGVKVQVIDLRGFAGGFMKYRIPECDLFLYSVTSPDFFEIKSLIGELRVLYPASKHAAGGAHINVFPHESSRVFDAIVLGEGEDSLIKLIRDFRNRRMKRIYDLKPNAEPTTYPFPRRHYIPESAVVNTGLFKSLGIRSTSALFARGCPFGCSFCANINRSPLRIKKAGKIKDEIAYLKREYKIGGIALNDEVCIPLNKKEAVPHLEAIGSMDIKWKGQTRVGVPAELMRLARNSGCTELALGVESASTRVLDIVNKNIKLEEAKKTIDLCRKNAIKVQMCLIIGLPGEPQNIVSLTKSFIKETRPDFVMLAGFCPYPGSAIFDKPRYYGIRRIDRDYSHYGHLIHRFPDYKDDAGMGLPFEYYPRNRWGKAFSRQEILENILELQDFLIKKKLNR